MKDMVASVSTGKIDKTLVLDLNKYEDSDFHEGEGSTDIPFTLTSRGDLITHLQLDGKIRPSEFLKLYDMAKVASKKVNEYQMRALKGEVIDENKSKK
jgi:ribonuclease PH